MGLFKTSCRSSLPIPKIVKSMICWPSFVIWPDLFLMTLPHSPANTIPPLIPQTGPEISDPVPDSLFLSPMCKSYLFLLIYIFVFN